MTSKVINIHDAKLKTVTIAVRTLTISDRQVTLSIFRQLQEEELDCPAHLTVLPGAGCGVQR